MTQNQPGLFGEIKYYLQTHKKWWLLPMILVFVLFGILVIVTEVAPIVSPFIYTLF